MTSGTKNFKAYCGLEIRLTIVKMAFLGNGVKKSHRKKWTEIKKSSQDEASTSEGGGKFWTNAKNTEENVANWLNIYIGVLLFPTEETFTYILS